MDIPIGRLEHATKVPSRDCAGSPSGKFFQFIVPPGEEDLHEHGPTEHETMAMLPDTEHTAKEERDEKGQIGDCRSLQIVSCKEHISGLPTVLFYHRAVSALIYKALLD
jgi:hypothetical protein